MSFDADRWDRRYRDAAIPSTISPPEIVARELAWAGPGTRSLDVACGFGDAGLALAQQGCTASLVDVSSVAIDVVARRAAMAGLEAHTAVVDLTHEPLPEGPWDLITCLHYLDRPLLHNIATVLAPGGTLAVAIATTTNLERHERPSARFLLDPGELPSLVPGVRTIRHDEAWRDNGAHEAWLVAVRDYGNPRKVPSIARNFA